MEEKHVHRYEIQVSDEWVIRWCPVCGKSWMMMKELIGSQYVWVEIEESEQQKSREDA